jgi:hypothetical protein
MWGFAPAERQAKSCPVLGADQEGISTKNGLDELWRNSL